MKHCNIKEDDPVDNDNADSNDGTSKKRRSMSLDRNADEQEEEVQQSIVASHSKKTNVSALTMLVPPNLLLMYPDRYTCNPYTGTHNCYQG